MRARDLLVDILLDSLLHLTPLEVDSTLRFVCRRYNACVEKYGAKLLPKHTVSIYRKSPPLKKDQYVQGELGWFSFDGTHSRHMIFNRARLQALLSSGRCRISLVRVNQDSWKASIFAEVLCGKKGGLETRGMAVEKLHLSGHCKQFTWPLVKKLKPTCLELCDRAFNMFNMDNRHPAAFHCKQIGDYFVFHIIPNGKLLFDDMRMFSQPNSSVVCHPRERKFWEFNLWERKGTERNVYDIISRFRSIARVDELHFPESVLIITNASGFRYACGMSWERELGMPDEPLRRVGKLAIADPPGYEYSTHLQDCEWKVWRVRNPRLGGGVRAQSAEKCATSVSNSFGSSDDEGGGGKYLRVMLKVGGNNSTVRLAVHLKIFDQNQWRKEEDISG